MGLGFSGIGPPPPCEAIHGVMISRGLNPFFFVTINVKEWVHMDGIPPLAPIFSKRFDPPLDAIFSPQQPKQKYSFSDFKRGNV